MNNEQTPVTKKQLDPKTVKNIKLYGALAVFVILVVIIIFNFRPAKYVSCITFLGNDIKINYVDGKLDLPSDEEIKRLGYTFEGWYTTDAFTEEYNPDTFTGKKLYAKYERIVYSIEYYDLSSNDFEDERTASNGVLIWNPDSFFIKYAENIKSDKAATDAWGKNVGTETDRVSKLYIQNPDDSDFVGWEVYKASDTEFSTILATLTPTDDGYCTLDKDIIIDYENETGIILKPIYE